MEYMEIPQNANICAPSDLFEYDAKESLNFREFYAKYKNQFPMLICIIGGNYGTTKYDCFDNLQVLRIHGTSHQKRVAVSDSRRLREDLNGLLTLPENTKVRFQQVYGPKKFGPSKDLKVILDEVDTLPINLAICNNPGYTVKIGSSHANSKDFDYLLVKEKYEEPFFMMNCIDCTDLKMNPQHCLACLCEDLEASPIKGFKYKSKLSYKQYCQQLSQQVATSGEKYDVTEGNPDFSEHSLDDLLNLLDVCEMKEGVIIREEEPVADDIYEEMLPILPDRVKIDDENLSQVATQSNTKPKTSTKSKIDATKSESEVEKVKDKQHGGKKGLFARFVRLGNKHTEKTDVAGKGGVTPTTSTTNNDDDNDDDDGGGDDDDNDRPPARPAKPILSDEHKIPPPRQRTLQVKQEIPSTALRDYQNTRVGRATVKPLQQNQQSTDDSSDDEGIYSVPTEYDDSNTPNIDEETKKSVEQYVDGRVKGDDDGPGYEKLRSPKSPTTPSAPKPPTTPSTRKPPTTPSTPKSPTTPSTPKALTTDKTRENPAVHGQVEGKTIHKHLSVEELSIEEICTKLKELKLDKYVKAFQENMISGSVLCELTVDDMTSELNMTRLEVARLSAFVKSGKVPN
ncbi:hypothetical protein ACF0H5_023286 [Mactra antiquata]